MRKVIFGNGSGAEELSAAVLGKGAKQVYRGLQPGKVYVVDVAFGADIPSEMQHLFKPVFRHKVADGVFVKQIQIDAV